MTGYILQFLGPISVHPESYERALSAPLQNSGPERAHHAVFSAWLDLQ